MVGYSDVAFRVLCRRFGAGMCFTEMISANAVVNGGVEVQLVNEEKPVGLQLFGKNAGVMLEAGKKFEKKVNVIDVNMGCPRVDIMQGGYGAALLRNKKEIKNIISALVDGLNIPVSVKVRKCRGVVEIAKIIERCGGSAIIVHGRTVKQGYSGKSDWKVIKEVGDNVDIVVIGNGDVNNTEDAEKMMKETGCDYVMIGRTALKNPRIFAGKNNCDSKEIFLDYLELAKKFGVNFNNIRNHAILFTKGMRGGARIRERINKCRELDGLEGLFNKLG